MPNHTNTPSLRAAFPGLFDNEPGTYLENTMKSQVPTTSLPLSPPAASIISPSLVHPLDHHIELPPPHPAIAESMTIDSCSATITANNCRDVITQSKVSYHYHQSGGAIFTAMLETIARLEVKVDELSIAVNSMVKKPKKSSTKQSPSVSRP